MATLQQSGRSENIGITPEVRFDDVSLVVAPCRDIVHALRTTELGVYDTSNLESYTGDAVSFDTAIGRTYPIKVPLFTLLEPMFTTPYTTYPFRARPTDVVVSSPIDATITSRAHLGNIMGLDSDDRRRPAYVIIGSPAFRAFLQSAIDQLDLSSQRLDEKDKAGVPMLGGDDFLCLRLVQIADQAGIPMAPILPPAHVDRAFEAFVLTTYTHNYRTLSSINGLGSGGAWLSGAKRFTRAYGVDPDEIADLAMMHNERILDLIARQSERLKANRPEHRPLDEVAARRMARYLVDGM